MKEQETKDKFLQLRAEGVSYEKISKMIKVSKPTLIEWGKSNTNVIEKLKAIRYEQILEKYKVTRENRIERIAKELQTVWKKYDEKDYKDLSKKDLLMIIDRLEKRLREETEDILNPKKKDNEEVDEDIEINIIRGTIYRDPETDEVVEKMDEKPTSTVIIKKEDLPGRRW